MNCNFKVGDLIKQIKGKPPCGMGPEEEYKGKIFRITKMDSEGILKVCSLYQSEREECQCIYLREFVDVKSGKIYKHGRYACRFEPANVWIKL